MLDPEMLNILDKSRDLEELLNFDYIIRDRIFTGDEVLKILEKYDNTDELKKLTDKHEILRDNVKRLAIKYNKLRKNEIDIKYDEKGVIIKELKKYKGEFVDNLLKKISKI